MDRLQTNPEAICADMAFHYQHDAIECTISGDFLLDHILFGQIDYSVTDHTCSVDVESSDNEKHTSNSEWQNACGVSQG